MHEPKYSEQEEVANMMQTRFLETFTQQNHAITFFTAYEQLQ
jgi:hypothetical protein